MTGPKGPIWLGRRGGYGTEGLPRYLLFSGIGVVACEAAGVNKSVANLDVTRGGPTGRWKRLLSSPKPTPTAAQQATLNLALSTVEKGLTLSRYGSLTAGCLRDEVMCTPASPYAHPRKHERSRASAVAPGRDAPIHRSSDHRPITSSAHQDWIGSEPLPNTKAGPLSRTEIAPLTSPTRENASLSPGPRVDAAVWSETVRRLIFQNSLPPNTLKRAGSHPPRVDSGPSGLMSHGGG